MIPLHVHRVARHVIHRALNGRENMLIGMACPPAVLLARHDLADAPDGVQRVLRIFIYRVDVSLVSVLREGDGRVLRIRPAAENIAVAVVGILADDRKCGRVRIQVLRFIRFIILILANRECIVRFLFKAVLPVRVQHVSKKHLDPSVVRIRRIRNQFIGICCRLRLCFGSGDYELRVVRVLVVAEHGLAVLAVNGLQLQDIFTALQNHARRIIPEGKRRVRIIAVSHAVLPIRKRCLIFVPLYVLPRHIKILAVFNHKLRSKNILIVIGRCCSAACKAFREVRLIDNAPRFQARPLRADVKIPRHLEHAGHGMSGRHILPSREQPVRRGRVWDVQLAKLLAIRRRIGHAGLSAIHHVAV